MLALIQFAYSKRMRSTFFSSEIQVVSAKKKRPTPLTWPSTEKAWRDLLLSTYGKQEVESENKPEVEIYEKVVAKKASELGVADKVHCECAVIAHLHQYTTVPAFSYVGVSRLACKPCYYWIKAFNETMSTKFSIRGSHDKWYTKWARPGFVDADTQVKVDASFLHLVEKELCQQRIASGEARSRGKSENSTSSEMTLDDLNSSEATYGTFRSRKYPKR